MTGPSGNTYRGVPLDPFQREAIDALDAGESVLVSAPTGAGKTLIAEYAIERALERGEPVVYTAPIKALSNQKYRDFSARFPGRTGVLTGDVSIAPRSSLVIMTTEIYRNRLLEDPDAAFARTAIFDEIHYLSDEERGTVWEESVIFTPPAARLLCLSATLPNLGEFRAWIQSLRAEPVRAIETVERPVPLRTFLSLKGRGVVTWDDLARGAAADVPPRAAPLASARQTVREVHARGRTPCLYFAFTRRRCEDVADLAADLSLVPPRRGLALRRLYRSLVRRYDLADHAEAERMERLVAHGVAYHHAGLLPSLKEVVERCFATGALALLAATETFALGINMPAATVVFDDVTRYDGVRVQYLSPRSFRQMSGRAGRRGMDPEGFVYAQVDPRDADVPSLRRVIEGPPEPIRSQLNLSYATILGLRRHHPEGLEPVLEKSFAMFEHRLHGGAGEPWRRELAARERVLTSLGYLHGGRPTPKGLFAIHVSGHEILATEAIERGILRAPNAALLAALGAVLVTEPRDPPRNAPRARRRGPRPPRPVQDLISLAQELRRAERAAGVRTPIRAVDAAHVPVATAWSRGAAFERLGEWTREDPGDVVRLLRQAIQVLRLVGEGLDGVAAYRPAARDALREGIPRAIASINRDEVDAERQMRLATR